MPLSIESQRVRHGLATEEKQQWLFITEKYSTILTCKALHVLLLPTSLALSTIQFLHALRYHITGLLQVNLTVFINSFTTWSLAHPLPYALKKIK